ncbi:MAG: VWA domain-containing protein [Clostridia bacterium]|nr:VWA domain-containing protein [Clostridia bacterium]
MKSNKKMIIIIAGIAAVLIIVVIGVLLAGKKEHIADKSSTPENTAQMTPQPSESLEPEKTEVTYEFEPEEPAQVWIFPSYNEFSEWTTPMPFINPMGNEENYSSIELNERSYYRFQYANNTNALVERDVFGDRWFLQIPFNDNKSEEENRQFVYDIESYIKTGNGSIMGYYEDSIVFIMTDQNNVRWWAEAMVDYDQILLNIVKQDELQVGQTIVINTADYEDNVVRFASYNPGDEYQSMYLEFDSGEVSFDIYTDNSYGDYVRSYRTTDTVYDALGTSFYYDSIMYDPGFSNWEVTWYDSDVTSEIRITLEKTGTIPVVKYAEPLGAIKVSSENVSRIEAFPVGGDHLSINHPEFSIDDFYMDQTPDGDFIMFVPSGLWDVKIRPTGDSLVTNYETLMVPVNSGEVTEVTIPFGISNALKTGNDDYNERGIRIGTLTENTVSNQVNFSFTLLDKSTKDILPDLKNTIVMENGVSVELVSINRVVTPPDVVLLLDSSGSMSTQMTSALHAAETFINGLPDDATIRIVDFDDSPRELIGSTKTDAIRNLTSIKVGGDTALYDAISMGLSMLMEEIRPILIVFTDGQNDVKNNTGLTLEETLDEVSSAYVPLFTIGFGKGHDSSTLESLANLSGGQYFKADDGAALEKVFGAINERLGNTYEAVYDRPIEASIGDVPVVSFVIDTSGSMLSDEEEYGSRIHNVKNLLRQFILKLPDEVLMQLTEFDDEVKIVQALTTDKMRILRGLGRLEAEGGTDITGSVLASYKTLKEIPSTKKVLIYITDAALDTTSEGNDFFLDTLSEIKDDGINTLWVGLGIQDGVEDFETAATLSGGEYIVTEDIDLLSETFARVLKDVQDTPDSGLGNIFIGIEKITDTGARESYSTSKLVTISPVKKSDDIAALETIHYVTGKLFGQYDRYTAEYISGFGLPAEDTIISKRMKLDKSGSNSAAEIRTEEIIFMKKLNGVEAPSSYRFMAITMEMENILEPQEVTVYPDGSSHPSSWLSGGAKGETKLMKIPYSIPDITSHFSVTFNGEGSYPASLASWICEKPLAIPGDPSVTIMPEESKSGTLVFLVPDVPDEQLSLHFYDINYGHINIPLVGEMKPGTFDITQLPKQEPSKLTDTFSLEITGLEDLQKIPGTAENDNEFIPGTGASFRVVEGAFISNMQALLNVDPFERFSLRVKTESGDFYLPLHPATGLLPAGFAGPRMISPGSFNKVKWLFEMPSCLADYTSEIFVELKDEDKTVPVNENGIYPGHLEVEYSSEFIDLTINELVKTTGEINGNSSEFIIADITIHDKKDGFASADISSLFSVVTDEFFEKAEENTEDESGLYEDTGSGGLDNFAQTGNKNTENRLFPAPLTDQLILGLTDDSIIFDGTDRRAIMLFQVSSDIADKDWYLYSNFFEDLKLKVSNGTYDPGLLAEKTTFETNDTFAAELNQAVGKAIETYLLNHPADTGQLINGNIPLGEEAVDKQDIPVPAISSFGAEKINQIDSVASLINSLKKLRYIPSSSSYGPFNHNLSMEALMTQGYGMEQDIADMFIKVMSRLGYQPKLKIVKVTDRGKQELSRMSGIGTISSDYLPAVSYMDENNNNHIIVIPFMEDLVNLKRLVYLDYSFTYIEKAPNTIRIEVNVYGKLTDKGVKEQIGDISDALGGDTEGVERTISEWLYDDYLALDNLSLDAIDIGFAVDGNKARVYLITSEGEIFGDQFIELDKFKVERVELAFDLPQKSGVVHVAKLDETMAIDEVFFTVSINAPDLSFDASMQLQENTRSIYDQAKEPSELSALRWYGRSIISDFIFSQTQHDQKLIKDMGLIAGRTDKPRVIIVTQMGGEKLRTSINLLEVNDQIHEGKAADIRSFNILSGLYASTLEKEVLPDNSNGLEEIWLNAPEETSLIFLDNISSDTLADLENAGLPEDIIRRFTETDKMILMTDKPSVIDGRQRWAWFEIDSDTYEMIAVIDTMEKGAFVEGAVIDTIKSAAQYAVGGFKGVENSIWSVAAFSLEKDDYKEILKAAKALALGIADSFGFNIGPVEGSAGSKLSISQTLGPVKFSFDGSASASQNILGFSDGYKAGVEYYFSQAD